MQDWQPPGSAPLPGMPPLGYPGADPEPSRPARPGRIAAPVLAGAVVLLSLVTLVLLAHGRRVASNTAEGDVLLAILLVFDLPPLAASAALAGVAVATVALGHGRRENGWPPPARSRAAVGTATGCGVLLAAATVAACTVLGSGPSLRAAAACLVAATVGGIAAVALSCGTGGGGTVAPSHRTPRRAPGRLWSSAG